MLVRAPQALTPRTKHDFPSQRGLGSAEVSACFCRAGCQLLLIPVTLQGQKTVLFFYSTAKTWLWGLQQQNIPTAGFAVNPNVHGVLA